MANHFLFLRCIHHGGRNLAQEIWFRVFIDRLALSRAIVERFHVVDGEPLCISRMTVRERRRVANGAEVPIRATTRVLASVKGLKGLNIGAITRRRN